MGVACWKPKATNTYSDCLIIVDLPVQQWLHKGATLLRIARLVSSKVMHESKKVSESELNILLFNAYRPAVYLRATSSCRALYLSLSHCAPDLCDVDSTPLSS